MQEAVERALDRADYVIASAQQRPPKRKCSSSGAASLFEKLYDIYVEECGKEPEATEELRSNANLLEKLVRRESLACLVVNLHPGGEGYSLMLEGKQGSCSETIRLPYEEGELLEYLDAEELPPALVDLLEQSQVNIFHCGCVIAQVRDYRQCSHGEPAGYQTRHVLLRPTMQTLACDMQSITSDGQQWTEEEKLLLESQLILATAEPLCLDPSLSVACAANRLLYNKQKMNTRPMKRSFKRYSAPSLTRQQELSQCPPPPELGLWASCKKSRQSQAGQRYDLKISKAGSCVDLWKRRPCDLAVPSEVDVQKYARGKRPARCHVSPAGVWPAPELRDDGVLGCEGGRDEPQTTELASTQPPSNPPFCGQRRPWHRAGCERPTSPPRSATDDRPNRVPPESKADAGRLVIRPEAVGQQKARGPATTRSPGPSGSAGPGGPPPGKQAQQPTTTTTTTTTTVSVWSPVLGKGVRHPPLRIRLPWSSGESSSGDSFPPGEKASSFLRSPPPAPAPAPPSLSQKPSVGPTGVSPLPAAALSTGSPSQRTLAPRVPADSQPPPGEAIRVRALPAAARAAPGSVWASAPAHSQQPSGEADSRPPPGEAIRVRALPAAARAAASSSQRPPATPAAPVSATAKSQPPPGEAIRVRALSAAALAAASSSQRSPATPATRVSAKPQKSAVELIRVSMFPAGALPTAGSSSRTTATPVTVKSQKSSVTQDAGVSRLPTTTLSPASSSQSSPATPVTATSAGRSVVQAAGPGGGAQAVAGACSPRQGSTAGSAAPAASKPSTVPSGARPPEAVSSAPPVRVQFFLKSASGLRPVTLLELPQDSLLLNAGQQPEQKVYQLIPQDQLQQALAPGPPPPVPQGSSAQGAASPRAASSAQPAVLVKFGAEGSLPQPQAAVSALAQLGSTESQRTPGQSQPRPLQALQLSPASSSQPQPQPQPPPQGQPQLQPQPQSHPPAPASVPAPAPAPAPASPPAPAPEAGTTAENLTGPQLQPQP